jgi:hypothetical protein
MLRTERAPAGLKHTARRAFLMEIDEAYCDVIVERWQNLTGRKAELLSPGPGLHHPGKQKTRNPRHSES